MPGTFFPVESVNPNLPDPSERVNLDTPQACVEHFILSCRRERWLRASHALNFRLLEPIGADQAAEKARRLFYLLNQNLWIDWSLLPDRPDGAEAPSMLSGGDGSAIRTRRSIRLGSISLHERDLPVHIERVKPQDGPPTWLFSAQIVENIDALYEARGPSWVARNVPAWARERLIWRVPVWQWLAVVLLLAVGLFVGWLVAVAIAGKIASRLPSHGKRLIQAIRWPGAIFTAAVVSYLAMGKILALPGPIAAAGSPTALVIVVLSATWLAVRIMAYISDRIIGDRIGDELSVDESGALARLTILRYVLVLLIVAVGLSVLLISMDLFRTLGIALLGSAGAAAVILGIAGHAVLGNLIAGIQIALTRPFRIGDTVIVEGYWGRIEELRYTFVTVRTWDEKRVVLPVKYFLNHWFENWTKTDRFLVKPIYLKVDYRADVQAIREKFLELVRQDEDWAEDRDEPDVLVVECGEETMTVRLTCGGKDSSSAWRLSCRIREKLIAWLQQYEKGRFLPRRRIVLHESRDGQKDTSRQDGAESEPEPSRPGGDSEDGAGD